MPALLYLVVMFALGDAVGRRFFPFVSIAHRAASAFLVGLLLSSWGTYGLAYMFSNQASPMLWGNLAFFAVAIGIILWLRQNPPKNEPHTALDLGASDFDRWDWVIAGVFLLFVTWMMFKTFTTADGMIKIGHQQFPDFGSTLSIMQSFAEGHNFPTQYTHFTGERIRYHFLFYFEAGNLEFLGLNPALANNILSIFSFTSLLLMAMTLGSVLFRSKIAGRIGAALLFFHGSLAFIPFLLSQPNFPALLEKLNTMTAFLVSGFPYRGEPWGVWSLNVYLNQRHLASAIAIFMLTMVYVVVRLREHYELPHEDLAVEPLAAAEDETEAEADDEPDDVEDRTDNVDIAGVFRKYDVLIFCGLLIGLLPMWNGAVFLGAAVVIAGLLLLFPLRREIMALAITAAIISLPQIIYLKTGHMKQADYSMFHWGFVIDNAGIFDVLEWTFYTFGFKWVLLGIALYFASSMQRRFIAAVSFLLPLTYCFRFSEEVLANHKFINMWLVVVNVFAGFALVKLWNLKLGSSILPSRILAVVLTVLVVTGGVIDLMPIKNSYFIEMKYPDDKLIEWVEKNTDPSAIFLSHRYVNHQILLAGRRLFFGDPYYAWGSDYDTDERENVVKTMFESKDPNEVFQLLKENNISYVAIDDQIRKTRQYIKNPNEELFATYFPVVFSDDSGEYGNMKIYKVPESLAAPKSETPTAAPIPGANAFKGGEGAEPGQFSKPRGICVDAKGFIYVADTFNTRVQKFSPDGNFVSAYGKAGAGDGELKEPNGVAVDEAGDIFVTDALNHKLVKYGPDGTFLQEWKNPEVGFYGPRDLVFGPNKVLYVIDQGHTRIQRYDTTTDTWTSWGTAGSGESQFTEATGICVGANMVFVADRDNHRIQVFDLDGKFIRQWAIEGWQNYHYPDVVYDDITKNIYVSDGPSNEILVFDMDAKPLPSLKAEGGAKFDNPSSIVISEVGKQRRLLVLNTDGNKVSSVDLPGKKADVPAKKGK